MDFQVAQIFPLALYSGKVDLSDEECHVVSDLLKYEPNATNDNELSVNRQLQLVQEKNLKNIHFKIQEHVDNLVYNVYRVCRENIKASIVGSWAIKIGPGQGQIEHAHKNSMISGVLYIHNEPNSGAIVFNRGKPYFDMAVEPPYQDNTIFNSSITTLNPVQGDIVMFPSYLNHSVLPNTSDKSRCSIAFDVFLEGNRRAGRSQFDRSIHVQSITVD